MPSIERWIVDHDEIVLKRVASEFSACGVLSRHYVVYPGTSMNAALRSCSDTYKPAGGFA
jgi:hypothetical protein